MGSKTPEHESQNGGNDPSDSSKPNSTGGEPRGTHLSRDGDGLLGDGDGDSDDDGDNHQSGPAADSLTPQPQTTSVPKKKKKKSKKKAAKKQSSPPRIPLSDIFRNDQYCPGEIQPYESVVDNTARTTAEEARYESRRQIQDKTWLTNYRKAAEIHRQVRRWTQDHVKPGHSLTDVAADIDDGVRALLGNPGLETGSCLVSGLGFPTGLAVNNCVAHWTPNAGQKDVILQASDVLTVDFGVHINGWIVDSAFTMSFDPTYDNLLAAVKDATNTGIKNAGADVRISDVSAAIQEAMESYEVEIRGKTYPVKAVRDLSGHNIGPYKIHGGKSIPFVKNKDQTKMEEGEVFAIETFGSTGRGRTTEGNGVYGYGKSYDAPKRVTAPLASARSLYKTINDNFGTIVFARRYLERLGVDRYLAGMNCLVSQGVVDCYQPLMDIEGSYSAQFEHTILLGESGKEVISRGDDY